MNLSFPKKDVLEELGIEDLIRELQRRAVPMDALAAQLQPEPGCQGHRGNVLLDASSYAVLQNLDDDELIEEVRERNLESAFVQEDSDYDLDQQDIDALAVALHTKNADRVFELSRRWVESRTGRIVN